MFLKTFPSKFSVFLFLVWGKNFLYIFGFFWGLNLFNPKINRYNIPCTLCLQDSFENSFIVIIPQEQSELYTKYNIRVVYICNAIKYKQLIFRSIFAPIILMYIFSCCFSLACKVKWTISLVSLHKHYVVINSIIAQSTHI